MEQGKKLGTEILSAGIAALLGLAPAMLLLLGAALLIQGGGAALTRAGFLAGLCCLLGALAAGWIAAGKAGRRRLPIGAAAGAIYFALLWVLGAMAFPGELCAFWPMLAVAMLGAVSGAMLRALRG